MKSKRSLSVYATYIFFIASSILGIAFPLRLLMHKYGPTLLELLDFLATNTKVWTSSFHLRYVLFNLTVLLCLLVFHRYILRWIEALLTWRSIPDQRFVRNLVSFLIVFTIFGYQTKVHAGFWHFGLAGWTYNDYKLRTISDKLKKKPSMSEAPPAFIEKAIVKENAHYLWKSGYLSGPAYFLHFKDKTVVPYNNDLLGFVFANYILRDKKRRTEIFSRVVRHTLARRRLGRSFFLPWAIAYPNHAPHMKIDYIGAPPSGELEKMTGWKVTLYVDQERNVEVVKAKKTREQIIE